MDEIDRIICETVQNDGRASSGTIAEAAGIPTSTANDRLRRLSSNGTISGWHATLNSQKVGAGLCCFILIDMKYEDEAEAVDVLKARPEVMELHHISGAHSYLAKIRVPNMPAVQSFLSKVLKPLTAVHNTETIFVMETLKETSKVHIEPTLGGESHD